MNLVDMNLVNLVDCPWGLRLQIRSLSLGFASPKSVLGSQILTTLSHFSAFRAFRLDETLEKR